jgi:hypothetical protein
MAFINTLVARAAAGIWGLKLGSATTDAVLAQVNSGSSLNSIIDSAFNLSYPASVTTASIASMVAANLGLTGQAATDGAAFIVATLGTNTATRGSAIADIINTFSTLTDTTYGPAAAAFNAKVAAAAAYSGTAGTADAVLGNLPSATSFNLGLGQDNITGTAGNDTFWAYIVNNANTWQSADWTDGGTGTDTLYADMGASQNFAVTPITTNVENIVIRGQSNATDSGNNNIASQQAARVNVDAERILGELRYESNNSRADVIVEDVRILSSQITKDITVAFVQSDPGNVDFGVYFDQHSLTANRTTSSQLILEVLDTRSTAQGLDPLLESPYDGVSFSLNGVVVSLRDTTTSTAIQAATTFATLLAAIQGAIARTPEAAGVTAALGPTFTVLDSLGTPVSGTQIILSATGKTFTTGNWIASAGVPANSSLHTAQIAGTSSTEDLVTSTVILDDVGRGSNGGDLVIGGLSTGLTSTSKGVDRFEITVDRTSRLQTINSTDNWLKEVTFKNGTTAGDVTVLGISMLSGGGTGTLNVGHDDTTDKLPGTETANGGDQHNEWGFSDVRLIDASAMTGRVTFDAEITTASFAKYILLTDTQSDPAGDNVSLPSKTTQRADFIYSGGSNNDSINVLIDGSISSSNSNIQPGREDFSFVVNGNGGNDAITVRLAAQNNDGLAAGVADLWYMHQKTLRNATIDSGDGNDTVRTPGAGDVVVRLGAGADTYYADNTGAQVIGGTSVITNTNSSGSVTGQRAVWVFGTADQATAGGGVAARELNNIASDLVNNTYGTNAGIAGFESLYRATITVTYKGLTAAVQLPVGVYRPSDLHVNQAIKSAINLDPVLSKLLVAEDGPLYSLVVKSLIDGDQVETDLGVVLTAYTVTTGLTLADERSAYSALNASDTTPTDSELQALLNDGKVQFDAKGDYVARFANFGGVQVVGADSSTPSDNTVTGAAGNDVLVFGTTIAAAANESSNDTAVYAAGFENDTIVWFQAGVRATGGDILNLTALGGTVALTGAKLDNSGVTPAANTILFATANTNGMVHVHPQTTGTDTATEIAALYSDSGNTTGSTLTSVYIAVDTTTNKGLVYAVTDPVGAANVAAVLAGTIDLADTLWISLTVDNFT